MNIAIITSGILPVPAVLGGAVENLIDFYLEYNEIHRLHNITIYSSYHNAIKKKNALISQVNHYEYIKTCSLLARIKARIYGHYHKNECYSYKLEYFFEQVYKKLKKGNYDVIILENRPGFALKLKQRINTTIITHLHTNMICSKDFKTINIIKATDRFIVVSDFLKKEIDSVGVPHNTIVVRNGLDPYIFNRKKQIAIKRDQIGMNDKDFVIIYTGRLVPAKGIEELIEAMSILADYPEIKLIVVGGENFADSNNQSPFIKRLYDKSSKMKERIFFTGYISYHNLPQYLASADVAAVPSHINEALGMTCIEAVAMGLPVIATNDGGIPETLVNQKHILVNKDKNLAVNLAKAVLQIKNNYNKYLGNNLNSEFTKESYSRRFFDSIIIKNG